MYKNLGIHWASSISGFLALVCLPFPWIFYKYGPPIRRRCQYAAESSRQLDAMADRMRAQTEFKMNTEAKSENGTSLIPTHDGLPTNNQPV